MSDAVNHPRHYNAHPSGIECIELAMWLPFCLGNTLKYLWRADHKGTPVQDLEKALWYLRYHLDHAFVRIECPMSVAVRLDLVRRLEPGIPLHAFIDAILDDNQITALHRFAEDLRVIITDRSGRAAP